MSSFKIRAPREQLAGLIGRAAAAAEKRSAGRAVMTGVLLEATGSKLTVTAADSAHQLALILEGEVTVEEAGRILVPAQILAAYLAKMPGDDITLEAADNQVQIKGGGPEFALRTLPVDDYPQIKAPEGDAVTVDGKILFDAVGRAMPAVGRDSSRPALTGVLIEVADNKTYVVATDSYRLAVSELDTEIGRTGSVIVPASDGIMTKVEKALGNSELEMRLGDNTVSFTNENGTAILRLIDAHYPAWKNLVVGETPYEARFEIAAFRDAMSRIELMTADVIPVVLEFSRGELRMSIANTEIGSGVEKMACEYNSDEEFKVALNVRYLKDGISALGTPVAVLKMTDPYKAIKIQGGDDRYTYVVMPVRA